MKNLKELVKIQSDKNGDEIIQYLKQRFEEVAEQVIIVKNKENDVKSILVGVNTKLNNINPIVLSGHIDTVSPDYNKYDTNPFDLTELDGKAYGLGSIDMKSFVAVILDKVEEIKKAKNPIVLAFTTDEETNLICIENVIAKFKELKIKPQFTIVGEPTSCDIKITANGCYEYEVEVFGKSCHSSIVANGINSISIIAKLITFIEETQRNYASLTSNCGVVTGGDIVNKVPDYAKLKFDIRSTSSSETNSFLNQVQGKITELQNEYMGANIKIIKLLEIPPLQNLSNPLITNISQKLNLNISKFNGGCEAGYYQKYSGDAIIFGVGDLNLAHKPNEYVVIEEYYKYAKLLIDVIALLCD